MELSSGMAMASPRKIRPFRFDLSIVTCGSESQDPVPPHSTICRQSGIVLSGKAHGVPSFFKFFRLDDDPDLHEDTSIQFNGTGDSSRSRLRSDQKP